MQKGFGIAFILIAGFLLIFSLTNAHPAVGYIGFVFCAFVGILALVRDRDRRIDARLKAIGDEPSHLRAVEAVSTPPSETDDPETDDPETEAVIRDFLAKNSGAPRDAEPPALEEPRARRQVSGGVILPPPLDPDESERPRLRLVHTDGKKLHLRNRPGSRGKG